MKCRKTGARRTILYSKFLMSVKMGRLLDRDEEVDHVNGNKADDALDNLEVVTRAENRRRQNKMRHRTMVSLICPACGVAFSRPRNNTHLVKGGSPSCCSRSCGAKPKMGAV